MLSERPVKSVIGVNFLQVVKDLATRTQRRTPVQSITGGSPARTIVRWPACRQYYSNTEAAGVAPHRFAASLNRGGPSVEMAGLHPSCDARDARNYHYFAKT
jgi:hypothetical protein